MAAVNDDFFGVLYFANLAVALLGCFELACCESVRPTCRQLFAAVDAFADVAQEHLARSCSVN